MRRSGRKKAVVPSDVARDDNVVRKAGKPFTNLYSVTSFRNVFLFCSVGTDAASRRSEYDWLHCFEQMRSANFWMFSRSVMAEDV